MSIVYNQRNFGIFTNGDFTNDDENFTNFNGTVKAGGPEGSLYLEIVGGGGANVFSNEYFEVDTSKTYQMIMYAKTFQRGSQNNSLAGGHLGFACYDEEKRFIDLRSLGGIGDTTLSRDANPGDNYLYIQNNNNWYTGVTASWRNVAIFPATHPKYSEPYKYTRVGYGDYNISYTTNITDTGSGDYAVELTSSFPNVGYPTPSGTPISNSRAGGTYNYALSNPNIPEQWTRYSTPPFSGTAANSSYPFRHGTKYIRFMCLSNYNQRAEVPQDHVWGIARVFFGECIGNRDYRRVL